MSVIGISMRCYLCCNKVRSGVYHPRMLYDAFADGDWSSEDPYHQIMKKRWMKRSRGLH